MFLATECMLQRYLRCTSPPPTPTASAAAVHLFPCTCLTVHVGACSVLRGISTSLSTSEKHFGGISDDDRIFQNIYGRHDTSIKVDAAKAYQGSSCTSQTQH
jgi:hypothetical protein